MAAFLKKDVPDFLVSDAGYCERGMKQEAQPRMLTAGAFTMKEKCVPLCVGGMCVCGGVCVSACEHRSGSPWCSEPNSAPLEEQQVL